MPNGGSGESNDSVYAKCGGGARGGLHLLGSPLTHALRVTVTPDPWVDHVLVAVVDDRLTHRLAIEVIGDRPTAEPVLLQNVFASLQVALVLDCFDDVEMITPAGNLEAVVAPARSEPADLLKWEVGPLSGEQSDRSWLSRLGLAGGFLQTGGVTDHRVLLVGA